MIHIPSRALIAGLALTVLVATILYLQTNDNKTPILEEVGSIKNKSGDGNSANKNLDYSNENEKFYLLANTMAEIKKEIEKGSQENLKNYKRIDKLLRELEERIKPLEDRMDNNEYEDVADSHVDAPGFRASEEDFGQRMEESLAFDDDTSEATETARNQTEKILAESIPHVNLENMSCTDGYCRAIFSQMNGKPPNLRELYGKPPYLNEAFTLNQEDGSVALYFTEPGVSLSELRTAIMGESSSPRTDGDSVY